MLSTALAGVLRVGAVLLTAGGLGTGVYFLIQAGEQEGDSLQASRATATAEAPRSLSPPEDVVAPEPTPTFPPAPITPPPIDTSDWQTYDSPLGFTIKYPPGWVVVEQDYTLSLEDQQIAEEAGFPTPGPGHAKIIAQETLDKADAGEIVIEGGTARLPPGASVAWFEIAPMPFPASFDVDALSQFCVPDDPPVIEPEHVREWRQVTFEERPAVRCFTEGPDRSDSHTGTTEAYWVRLPSGRMGSIVAYVFDGDETTFALVEALLSTVSFEDVQ